MQGDKQSGSNDSGSTSAGQTPRLKSFANDVSDTWYLKLLNNQFILRGFLCIGNWNPGLIPPSKLLWPLWQFKLELGVWMLAGSA